MEVLAKVGGALGIVGAVLTWLSLVLPWWEAGLFGSLTLWQTMGLDRSSSVVIAVVVLMLLASGLLGLVGGSLSVVLHNRTGLALAGSGALLAGAIVGLVVLLFLVGLYAGGESLVRASGGLIAAALGSLLLFGGGLAVVVGAIVKPAPTAPGRPPHYGGILRNSPSSLHP